MTLSRTPLRLDPAACDGCGRCTGACTRGALKVGVGYIYVDWARCDGCGACVVRCDREAIVLRDVPVAAPVAAYPEPSDEAATGRLSTFLRRGAQPRQGGTGSAAVARPGAVSWSLAEGALVVAAAFALLLGAQAVAGALSGGPIDAGAMLLVYDAVLAGLLVSLAIRRKVRPLAAFRLDVAPEWHLMLVAAAVAVGTWAFALVYRISAQSAGIQPPAESTDLARLFGGGPFGAIATFAVIAVIGPIVEEAALRGVLLGAIRERFGPWVAIVASALVFALLHASAWSFVPLAALGLALGWLAQRSRSLIPAVFVHVAYNGLLVAAALYVAGRG